MLIIALELDVVQVLMIAYLGHTTTRNTNKFLANEQSEGYPGFSYRYLYFYMY